MSKPYKTEEEVIHKVSDIDMTYGDYTYNDYLKWQFDEMVEIIRGKVFRMSPAPNSRHQQIATSLTSIVYLFFEKHSCNVFAAPFDVRFPNKNGKSDKDIHTVVQPDLCVICEDNKIDERGCIGAPDLIVEILSPSTSSKDLNLKYALYEEFEVKEYWIVYPTEESVHVYTLIAGKYQQSGIYTKGYNIISPLFPELEVDLNRVFPQTKIK